jgi:phytoene synthase
MSAPPIPLRRSRGRLAATLLLALAAVLAAPGLGPACAELAGRAHALFGRARGLVARCNRGRVRPAILMLEAYHRILRRLEARGWERPEIPVRLSRIEKLWIALRYRLY